MQRRRFAVQRIFRLIAVVVVGLSLIPLVSACSSKKKEVILATTTSTQDTGLLDVLKPAFEKKTGYLLKVVAVGTGQALAMGEKGEADVLLVHAPSSEEKLVESGAAINRRLVMHNDFVIVGPSSDPAGIKGLKRASEAFVKIAQTKSVFVSRGDDSGTHKKEQEIWAQAKLKPEGSWYLSAGAGMGQTLRIASEKSGYTLTDRGTFLAQRKSLSLEVLVEGDPILLNIYHVMEVNPEKFKKINAAGGKAFADFIVSPEGQKIVGEFGMDKFGSPLFIPDAGKKEFN
ncbi:MAG TPA: solute-binding protein [Firmicutes bacterium]|nr:solute-binding protein [Bacillota bacterium]